MTKIAVAALLGFIVAATIMLTNAKWLGAALNPSRSTIEVTGESRLTGEPDTALVMFTLEQNATTIKEGQEALSKTIAQLIAALNEAGIDKSDIATTRAYIGSGWRYYSSSGRHNIYNTLTVTVRNVEHVGRVIDTALAGGVTRLKGVAYEVRDPRWAQKALDEALQDAQNKAARVAAGSGRKLGQMLSFRELDTRQTSPSDEYQIAARRVRHSYQGEDAFDNGAVNLPTARVLPGERALTTRVAVVYEL